MRRTLILAAAGLAVVAAPAAAQTRVYRFGEAAPAESATTSIRPIRIAKWAAFAATVGVATYGFLEQRAADEEYEILERACSADPEVCNQRLPDGSFADPALEQRYQRVVELDQRARLALIGTQVGVVASVVLFVLDVRRRGSPPNIPYDPEGVEIRPRGAHGIEIGWVQRLGP